jgi:hypothetical protein
MKPNYSNCFIFNVGLAILTGSYGSENKYLAEGKGKALPVTGRGGP